MVGKTICDGCKVLTERERSARRGGWAQPKITAAILNRDSHKCTACGDPCPHLAAPGRRHHEVDHILPLSQGGDNRQSNLRTLCQSCHREQTKRQRRVPHAY